MSVRKATKRAGRPTLAVWAFELVGIPAIGVALGVVGVALFWVALLILSGPVLALISVLTSGRGGYVGVAVGGHADGRVGAPHPPVSVLVINPPGR